MPERIVDIPKSFFKPSIVDSFGFLKSKSNNNTFLFAIAKLTQRLIPIKLFPSPETDDVIKIVLLCAFEPIKPSEVLKDLNCSAIGLLFPSLTTMVSLPSLKIISDNMVASVCFSISDLNMISLVSFSFNKTKATPIRTPQSRAKMYMLDFTGLTGKPRASAGLINLLSAAADAYDKAVSSLFSSRKV